MLLARTKEREYRFKLALRMGLPIFALVLLLVLNSLFTSHESLETSFFIELTFLLAFSIYFIFYLIYNGFDVQITELVSKTFTRDFLYKYLRLELSKNREYTLVLISVDNLSDINLRYGIKNGDKTLERVAAWIGEYLEDKGIKNFPMGHVKGGDFVLGLKGLKSQYNTLLELICLKSSEFKVDDIEVKISGAITDTSFSNKLEYLIENLFEIQEERRNLKLVSNDKNINPSSLEAYVINAIKNREFSIMTQSVFEKDAAVMGECFVKLKTTENKVIHPKTYMKVIDRLGLMLEYDLMILEKIVNNYASFDADIVAITVSPTSLRNQTYMTKAKELLNDNQELKNKIMFILSELEYYSYTDRYNTILKTLKKAGILIAIDRLGAINTSFLYLKELDIDVVRFDSSYTKEIKNKKYKSIIEGFNVMAHNLGVKTWIKMIEDEDSKNIANELKIDYIQGKYLSSLEQKFEN